MEVFLWVNNGNAEARTVLLSAWNAAKRSAGKNAEKSAVRSHARRRISVRSHARRRVRLSLAVRRLHRRAAAMKAAAAEFGLLFS